MRIEWISEQGSDRLILFFNGWGMDTRAVRHLMTTADVLAVCDYRRLEDAVLPSLGGYARVEAVAWSMGVWAAANLLPAWGIIPHRLVAINGTEFPVHDGWGIPSRIYALTERGMNAAGREKFMHRMLAGREEVARFGENRPLRELSDVCEELACIRTRSASLQNTLSWNRVYVSTGDVIFPAANQLRYWQGRVRDIRMLPGGHYPFYQVESWDEL